MMQHANCLSRYWGLAMSTAVYLQNILPTPAASGGCGGVPYTLLYGFYVDISYRKVFDCFAYLRPKDRYVEKLSPKALHYMLIGYCGDGPGYSIHNLLYGELIRIIHITFVKSQHTHVLPPRRHVVALLKPLHHLVSQHITSKELKAVRLVVLSVLPYLVGRNIFFHEDNHAVCYVLAGLTSRSPEMMN
jgi:hypothetical protein